MVYHGLNKIKIYSYQRTAFYCFVVCKKIQFYILKNLIKKTFYINNYFNFKTINIIVILQVVTKGN